MSFCVSLSLLVSLSLNSPVPTILLIMLRDSARIHRLNYCPACAPYFRSETLVTQDGRSRTNPCPRIKMPRRPPSIHWTAPLLGLSPKASKTQKEVPDLNWSQRESSFTKKNWSKWVIWAPNTAWTKAFKFHHFWNRSGCQNAPAPKFTSS